MRNAAVGSWEITARGSVVPACRDRPAISRISRAGPAPADGKKL
jgi:hypothetical protein